MPLLQRGNIPVITPPPPTPTGNYNNVPGYTSTNPTFSSTGSGTGVTSGGLTNFQNYASMSLNKYGSVGNPILDKEADKQYFIPSFLTNYAEGSRQYNQDTAQFGMLASFFGPNLRYSQTLSVKDLYGNTSGFSSEGERISVNATVNWDLANMQNQQGSVAWYRNLAKQSANSPIYGDPDSFNKGTQIAMDFIASRNVKFGTAYNEAQKTAYYSTPQSFITSPEASRVGQGVTTSKRYTMSAFPTTRYF